MLITFNYKTYFKFLPTPKNNYAVANEKIIQNQKDILTKKYIIDSYILWLYIKYLCKNLKNYKNDYCLDTNYLNIKFKLIITAKTSSALTLVKAPMAHKTWSKEQVGFKYFNVRILIFVRNIKQFLTTNKFPLNLNTLIYLFNYIKNYSPKFTNSIFILDHLTLSFDYIYKPKLYL